MSLMLRYGSKEVPRSKGLSPENINTRNLFFVALTFSLHLRHLKQSFSKTRSPLFHVQELLYSLIISPQFFQWLPSLIRIFTRSVLFLERILWRLHIQHLVLFIQTVNFPFSPCNTFSSVLTLSPPQCVPFRSSPHCQRNWWTFTHEVYPAVI